MSIVNDYRLKFGKELYVPIISGGMGVDISTSRLALEVCRLGGVGHISDAMVPFVSDKLYGTNYCSMKGETYKESVLGFDKSSVKFISGVVREAQTSHVRASMDRKEGPGLLFINVMEKLTMAAPAETLGERLNAALDAGIDGITLSAGLHMQSMKLMEGNPRFHDAKIGIIVSSSRALNIFLRSAFRSNRLPDYIVVEGPLAGGHLGFGLDDWKEYRLQNIVEDVLNFLNEKNLDIPVIAAGGIFTGGDAVEFLQMGAGGVQVATRFAISKECGYPDNAKQALLNASEDDVIVSGVSPTGYPLRLLKNSPCFASRLRPQCEPLGYILDGEGKCQYLDFMQGIAKAENPTEKICLCQHFGKYNCWTCGHYVYRLKETTNQKADGSYQLPSVEHIFLDYQFSAEHSICKPEPETRADPQEVAFAWRVY